MRKQLTDKSLVPVAWQWRGPNGNIVGYSATKRPEEDTGFYTLEPLFAYPPQPSETVAEALEAMLHAVCGETGFAACVRHDSGLAYPWPALDAAEEKARSALRALKGDNANG